MFLAKVLHLLAACALALVALGANARAVDAFQVQNMPLEKIQLLYLDCPRVWLAQAVDAPGEIALAAAFVRQGQHIGQYFDEESNLSYNYFRSYQPSQGRYPQPDPIGLAGGSNRFGYADANPLSVIDPLGLMGQGSGTNGRSWGAADPTNATFTITKRGVCDGADAMCAPGMQAAGLAGPYFSETKRYSGVCLAKLGLVVKGGGVVAGNAAAKQVPRIAEAVGAGARSMGIIGRGISLFTNPATTGASLGFAIPALLEHCEVKEPHVCTADGR